MHEVNFHPLAENDLLELYAFIADRSGAARAADYVGRIEAACLKLADFPFRSTPRDDIETGVRTISLQRRVLIPVRVTAAHVTILRVLYAGRHFSAEEIPD